VQGLGKNNITTLLLTTPPYLIGVIVILINAWDADRTGERYLHVALPPIVAVAAFIIAATTTSFAPRYLAMCLMVGSTYCGFVVTLGWISNILPRPPAKRAAALAGINMLSNLNQIYSPYLYPTSAGPRYVVAMSVNTVFSFLAVVFATILRMYLVKLNKKLDAGEPVEDVNTLSKEQLIIAEAEGLPLVAPDNGFRFLY